MFLYNIAFSLEFIVLGLGALMIGWAQFKCAKWKMVCEGRLGEVRTGTTPNLTTNVTGASVETRKHCDKHACGTGLVKSVGIILIILALANFGDTINNAIKFHKHRHMFREKMQMLHNEYNNNTTTTGTSTSGAGTQTAP